MTQNKNRKILDPEYGVDSRYSSIEERKADGAILLKARLERLKNLSPRDILHAKLAQLKFKMEDFLEKSVQDDVDYFAMYLQTYVDAIYKKRSVFAQDIAITPVRLSQIINGHRAPSEAFIKKLMIHSEQVFNDVTSFQTEMWYKVYFHEKICDTLNNQNKWRPEIEKLVTVSEPILKYGKKDDKK